MTLTDAQIRGLLEMEEKATPGPLAWDGRSVDDDGYVFIGQGSYLGETLIQLADTYEGASDDCDLLAAARNHLRELCEEVLRLRAENERLRSAPWAAPWMQLARTSPSGKVLYACTSCGRVSPTPDKHCRTFEDPSETWRCSERFKETNK